MDAMGLIIALGIAALLGYAIGWSRAYIEWSNRLRRDITPDGLRKIADELERK